jgi:hypothetical protein
MVVVMGLKNNVGVNTSHYVVINKVGMVVLAKIAVVHRANVSAPKFHVFNSLGSSDVNAGV